MSGAKRAPQALLTPVEAAEFLAVSIDTLSRWRQNGTGPRYVKFTRAKQGIVRYRPADIESFIAARSKT